MGKFMVWRGENGEWRVKSGEWRDACGERTFCEGPERGGRGERGCAPVGEWIFRGAGGACPAPTVRERFVRSLRAGKMRRAGEE